MLSGNLLQAATLHIFLTFISTISFMWQMIIGGHWRLQRCLFIKLDVVNFGCLTIRLNVTGSRNIWSHFLMNEIHYFLKYIFFANFYSTKRELKYETCLPVSLGWWSLTRLELFLTMFVAKSTGDGRPRLDGWAPLESLFLVYPLWTKDKTCVQFLVYTLWTKKEVSFMYLLHCNTSSSPQDIKKMKRSFKCLFGFHFMLLRL